MPAAYTAEEVLGIMPDVESGKTVVRARLACGCILEKMVPPEHLVATRDGKRQLVGKYPCVSHNRR